MYIFAFFAVDIAIAITARTKRRNSAEGRPRDDVDANMARRAQRGEKKLISLS